MNRDDIENTGRHNDLEEAVRNSNNLSNRLMESRERIGKMCKELRPPKMTIPVQWDDDDFFIVITLNEAIRELHELRNAVRRLLSESCNCVGVIHDKYCSREYALTTLERTEE